MKESTRESLWMVASGILPSREAEAQGEKWRKRAEELFFSSLFESTRNPKRKSNQVDPYVVIQSVEMAYRQAGKQKSADLIDVCMNFIQSAWVNDESSLKVLLTLLAVLSRTPDDNGSQDLSPVAQRLLVSAKVFHNRNKLRTFVDVDGQLSDAGQTSARQVGDGEISLRSVVPINARQVLREPGSSSEPIRFEFSQKPPKNRHKLSLSVNMNDRYWPSPKVEDEEEENWQFNINGLDGARKMLSESVNFNLLREKPVIGNIEQSASLFGALLCPKRQDVSLISRLSLPDINKESNGFAPDPLGKIIDACDKTKARPSSTENLNCETLMPPVELKDVVEALENAEDNIWLRLNEAGMEDSTALKLFSWEEEVPQSFVVQAPILEEEKSIQYANYALMSSERGEPYFERSMQKHGYFKSPMVSIHHFLRDCVLALVGIESDTFQHQEGLRGPKVGQPVMMVVQNTRVPGLSPDALHSLLQIVRRCGDCFERLVVIAGTESTLSGFDVGETIKEFLSEFVLGYQRQVMALGITLAERPSLINLERHVSDLGADLAFVVSLFKFDKSLRNKSLHLIESLYSGSIEYGVAKLSIPRKLLEVSLSGLLRTVYSWLFACADGEEFLFDGEFFLTNREKNRSWVEILRAIFSQGCSFRDILLNLPSFLRSSIRSLDSEHLARRVVACGCMLRVLREEEKEEERIIFSALTKDVSLNQLVDLPFNLRTISDVNNTTSSLQSRKARCIEQINANSDLLIKVRGERQAKISEELIAKTMLSQEKARDFVARLEKSMKDAEEDRMNRNRAAYEVMRVAAEEAKRRKFEERQAELQRDQERSQEALTVTSPVSSDDRKMAENVLRAQIEAFVAEAATREGGLSGEERASLSILERALEELREDQTSIKLPSSIVVLQAPGGKSTLGEWFQEDAAQKEERPSVKILADPGGKSVANEYLDGSSKINDAMSSVKVAQPPGGESSLKEHLDNISSAAPVDPDISQAREQPNLITTENDHEVQSDNESKEAATILVDTSSMKDFNEEISRTTAPQDQRLDEEEEEVEKNGTGLAKPSVRVSHAPGGPSTLSQHLDGSTRAVMPNASIRVVEEPGGASTMSSYLKESTDVSVMKQSSVKISKSPGDEETHAKKSIPKRASVKVTQVPGGISSLAEHLDSSTLGLVPTSSVKITAEPGGASVMRSYLEQNVSISETARQPRTSVRVAHAPGGKTSLKLSSNNEENKCPEKTSSRSRLFSAGLTSLPKSDEKIQEESLKELTKCLIEPKMPQTELWDATRREEESHFDEMAENVGQGKVDSIAPLDVALEIGVVEAIVQQCDLIEFGITRLITVHSNLEEHLEGLKKYLFLSQGDLFCFIVDWFCDAFVRKEDLCTGRGKMLDGLVELQVLEIGLLGCPFVKHFQYGLEPSFDPRSKKFGNKDIYDGFEHFRFLRVKYELGWPLNVILEDGSVEKLGEIHRFLLSVKFAQALAKRIWMRLKEERRSRLVPWLTWRWHQVRHLMATFEGYLLTEIVHEEWSRMVTGLVGKNKESDQIRTPIHFVESFSRFMHCASSACFLDSSKGSELIRKCIERALSKVVVFFEHSLAGIDSGAEHPSSKIAAAWKDFENTQQFLVRTVQSYSNRNVQNSSGPSSLLMHINFNGFFGTNS